MLVRPVSGTRGSRTTGCVHAFAQGSIDIPHGTAGTRTGIESRAIDEETAATGVPSFAEQDTFDLG